jgi:hypothetical protein
MCHTLHPDTEVSDGFILAAMIAAGFGVLGGG